MRLPEYFMPSPLRDGLSHTLAMRQHLRAAIFWLGFPLKGSSQLQIPVSHAT